MADVFGIQVKNTKGETIFDTNSNFPCMAVHSTDVIKNPIAGVGASGHNHFNVNSLVTTSGTDIVYFKLEQGETMTGITAATDPYQRRILYTGSKLYWMKMDIAEKCPRPNREFGVEVYKPNGELIWAGGSKVMPKFKYHLNSQPWTSAHLTNLIEEKTTYSLTSGRDLWVLPDFGPPTPFQGGGHKMGLKRKKYCNS